MSRNRERGLGRAVCVLNIRVVNWSWLLGTISPSAKKEEQLQCQHSVDS